MTENADFQDELDIMVRKNDGNNNSSTYLNDEALNRINKSKTQSTAAHGSVKNNMSNSFGMDSFDVQK